MFYVLYEPHVVLQYNRTCFHKPYYNNYDLYLYKVLCFMFYIDLVGIHLILWAQYVSYEATFMLQGHVLCFMFYMSHMICMPYNPFTIILTLKIWSVQNRFYVLCFIYISRRDSSDFSSTLCVIWNKFYVY